MYRQRVHIFPKTLDAYREVLATNEEMNKLAAEKGWAEGTLWGPAFGELEVVVEYDYPDLATFEHESKAMVTEPRALGVMQRVQAIESTRPFSSELLETAVAM